MKATRSLNMTRKRLYSVILAAGLVLGGNDTDLKAGEGGDLASLVTDISRQISACLVVPSVVPQVYPRIRMKLASDGSLSSPPEIMDDMRQPGAEAAGKAILRAVQRCAPYKIDSRFASRHALWQDIIIRVR